MTPDSRHRRLLANRYQLVELIGSGAMGQVYRAEDKLLGGVTVAVKFLSQALLNPRMKERFEREATISALLGEKSMHIVRVRDYGLDEKEIPFYVMEYLQGENISDVIKYRPLKVDRFLKIARQICFGLDCAHKGILFQGEACPVVHRDIKPSNVLLVEDPALGELVKILDFGIAKLVQAAEESKTQAFMGTLAYCSPEQMEGKELDSRSDIYSLGIMMYEMVTGEMPLFPDNSSFGGWYEAHHHTKPQSMSPRFQIPNALETLIMNCLAKLPKNRPQSVEVILRAIDAIEAELNTPPISDLDKTQIAPHLLNAEDMQATVVAQRFANPSKPLLSANDLCRQMSWPKDKPKQKIVFPHILTASEGKLASLWVMLNEEDILTRMSSIRYNQFLLMTSPHPMILWITVLFHREYGPRWLPCYLDLKTPSGQRFAHMLGESGTYWILFFALENPSICQQVLTATVAPNQCKLLKEWAQNSQMMQAGKPQVTKRLLKQEFEKLKPKIEAKLSQVKPSFNKEVSGL
ncbi:MAG: serine/threonine protein kinase [Cyanobacteriota bacterium]|jgi:serine/threonine-protein kinase